MWASNCENHSEQVIENSPYLLVDIIIPAEVSWPPWKDMDMNMLEMWNQIMVIAKVMTFLSRQQHYPPLIPVTEQKSTKFHMFHKSTLTLQRL